MFEALLTRYVEQFNDNFPLFTVRDLDEGEVIQAVQKCLDENKPLIVECPDGMDYWKLIFKG